MLLATLTCTLRQDGTSHPICRKEHISTSNLAQVLAAGTHTPNKLGSTAYTRALVICVDVIMMATVVQITLCGKFATNDNTLQHKLPRLLSLAPCWQRTTLVITQAAITCINNISWILYTNTYQKTNTGNIATCQHQDLGETARITINSLHSPPHTANKAVPITKH